MVIGNFVFLIKKMARTNERRRSIHEPATFEIFRCLRGSPSHSKLMLDKKPSKLYNENLGCLLQKEFYNNQEDRWGNFLFGAFTRSNCYRLCEEEIWRKVCNTGCGCEFRATEGSMGRRFNLVKEL